MREGILGYASLTLNIVNRRERGSFQTLEFLFVCWADEQALPRYRIRGLLLVSCQSLNSSYHSLYVVVTTARIHWACRK